MILDGIANLCAVGEQVAAAMWDAATLRLVLGGSAQPRDLQDLAAVCGERDEEIRNWSRGSDGARTARRGADQIQRSIDQATRAR
ncbi:TraM recognition domain-containing protein [Kribbella sp. NPDC051718]|uniref:TraM recognition domain-containing protein n=1 Tax=Kribbella sp. NPDC051718 TaxID=3155168 RepID=UPI003445CB9A